MNIINDFSKSKESKRNKVYEIREYMPSKKLYCYIISEATHQSFPKIEDSIGIISKRVHNRTADLNKRVFFWSDSITPLSKSIILKLQKHKMIDSTYIKIAKGEISGDVEIMIKNDDSKKAMFYYVCKENFSMFEKIYRSYVLPVEKYPEVKCSD